MSDPIGTLYDGDHEKPFICGPIVTWVDEETRAKMTKIPYRVRAPFYKPLPRGARNPLAPQASLIEQPKPKIVVGDLYEYDLIFATVPQRPDEPLPYVMNYQIFVRANFTDPLQLMELAIPLTATVSWTYYNTTTPEKIKLREAFRVVELAGRFYGIGTQPKPTDPTWLAENETLTRKWEGGNIWEKKSIIVPAPGKAKAIT